MRHPTERSRFPSACLLGLLRRVNPLDTTATGKSTQYRNRSDVVCMLQFVHYVLQCLAHQAAHANYLEKRPCVSRIYLGVHAGKPIGLRRAV